ncbi:Galactose oxidase, beta-propeller [Parasponia andersonii]|uniref:Galactose oxidase, beta-propeller n=1 Tax=Parasponia andersonii TaxID=3476 RepID=A0A2P5BG85_PARAD|nr:Galactose oxidase, beta-propeller [Parasponia andersonii]
MKRRPSCVDYHIHHGTAAAAVATSTSSRVRGSHPTLPRRHRSEHLSTCTEILPPCPLGGLKVHQSIEIPTQTTPRSSDSPPSPPIPLPLNKKLVAFACACWPQNLGHRWPNRLQNRFLRGWVLDCRFHPSMRTARYNAVAKVADGKIYVVDRDHKLPHWGSLLGEVLDLVIGRWEAIPIPFSDDIEGAAAIRAAGYPLSRGGREMDGQDFSYELAMRRWEAMAGGLVSWEMGCPRTYGATIVDVGGGRLVMVWAQLRNGSDYQQAADFDLYKWYTEIWCAELDQKKKDKDENEDDIADWWREFRSLNKILLHSDLIFSNREKCSRRFKDCVFFSVSL